MFEFEESCRGCPDGKRRSIDDAETNAKWAEVLFSPHSKIDFLILNSGAWYSTACHIKNSTIQYEEMLQYALLPSLKKLMLLNSKMQVYWVDLPPYVAENNSTPFLDKKNVIANGNSSAMIPEVLEILVTREFIKHTASEQFEWKLMQEKNDQARKYLVPAGVHFLNTRPALLPRKEYDPMISVDGLHWW